MNICNSIALVVQYLCKTYAVLPIKTTIVSVQKNGTLRWKCGGFGDGNMAGCKKNRSIIFGKTIDRLYMERSIVFEKTNIHFWENDRSFFWEKAINTKFLLEQNWWKKAKKSVGKSLPTLDLQKIVYPSKSTPPDPEVPPPPVFPPLSPAPWLLSVSSLVLIVW